MISRVDSRKFFVCFTAVLALLLGILLSRPLYGQVAGATLSGVITDESGGAIPNATVSIKNVATGVTREVKTGAGGFYTAPNLLPGSYEITASASGFATAVKKDVTLTVGAEQTLNLTMRVGQLSETVQVTGAPPTVDLASSTISANVDETTVRELPLNGRDWTTLATLQPGVDTVPVQQTNGVNAPRGNRGYGNQMTISGTRPQQNNYRLDGVSINDYSNGAPGSVVGVNLGVDAIAEFSVLTSNYSAEYGRTSGGVINAITRSGTNRFHGGAYEFLRNSALDARNFFDGATVPPFKRNQFGASAGGPIIKDKTFIFGDYEGLRQSLAGTSKVLVPSATARMGELCNMPDCSTFTMTHIATNGIAPFLVFWPTSAGPNICPFSLCVQGRGDTAFTSIVTKTSTHENFFTIRADHKISEKDSLFGTYMFDDAAVSAPDPLNTWVEGNLSRRQMIALEESHLFSPSVANSVRLGFSRVVATVNSAISGINTAATDNTLSIYTTHPQFAPQIAVGGLQQAGGGLGSLATYKYHWNSYQVYDDAFWTRGLHSLKFGFALERMQDNALADLQPTGLYGFSSINTFFNNNPTNLIATLPGFLTPRGIRETIVAGYVQDDWRIRPHLTLNLGLRYEMATVPTEVQGKLTNLRTMTNTGPMSFHGSPYFQNPTKKNFEPRLGMAWDPFGDGKTSVRAAFGIFDFLPLPAAFALAIDQSEPFYLFGTTTNFGTPGTPVNCQPNTPGATSVFPTCGGAILLANQATQTGLQSAFIEFNPKRNYVMIWSLNVQRDLGRNTNVMVGYVGNRGVNMLNREDDVNSVLPTQTAQGYLLWPNTGTVAPQCTSISLTPGGCKVNTTFGDIRGIYWTGDAFYDALEAEFKERIGAGFQLQASYTWGKAIDTGSATVIGDPFQNSISSPYFFCKSCRRGLSDFNIAHSFVGHFLWDVPVPKSWTSGSVGSMILGGWELGSILTAQTGVPFSVVISGDSLGLGSADPWAFPSVLNTPACHSPVNSGNPDNYLKLGCFTLPLQPASISDAQCNFGKSPNPITDPTTGLPACLNLRGNLGRNALPGPGLLNLDFSVFKNFPIHRISEAFNVQFRAEMFNILNHSNFAPPFVNAFVFAPTGATSGPGATLFGGAGALDHTTTTSRQIQFGLKINW